MANLPDALQLREIKYGLKTTDAERTKTARLFIDAGRMAEALDLFLLAGDEQGIRELLDRARNEGRPVLLLMARRAGRTIDAATWKAAGDAALRAQRWRDAFRAYTEAGDEAGLERVREAIPDYEVYIPQGK